MTDSLKDGITTYDSNSPTFQMRSEDDPRYISPLDQSLIERRVDKIKQVLFWYDNIPDDERIVALVKEWHDLNKRLIDAGLNQFTIPSRPEPKMLLKVGDLLAELVPVSTPDDLKNGQSYLSSGYALACH